MTIGTRGATRLGNTRLIEHGIQNEESHIRAHVCPKARKVYVFPTAKGVEAIQSGKYPYKNGYQDGIPTPTAGGYIVPPFDIELCTGIELRPQVWDALTWPSGNGKRDNKQKGDQAVVLIQGMLKRGLFPIPAIGTTITDKEMQVKGTDIIVRSGAIRQQDIVIQVKCDLPGGEKPGGSGNLFLQTEECNPFRVY